MQRLLFLRLARLVAPGLLLCSPCPALQAVSLVTLAEVRQNTIRLSDLLPPEAGQALRQASAAIELGRSPQAGSLRVLEAAQIAGRLAAAPDLLRQLAIPDRIVIRRTGFRIPREAIRQAISGTLRAEGNDADLAESVLQWSGEVTSSEENPALQIESMHLDPRRQALEVRLHCVQRTSCGSFLAYLRPRQPLLADWKEKSAAQRSGVAKQPASGEVLAQPGKRATLVLADGAMRISVPVICLERGALGQQVRVLDTANHRVFTAEVQRAGILLTTF